MLLIDGVKYEEWIPRSEEEFEQVVKEHSQEIFGEQSVYFDKKEKLRSLAGIGSTPDGYVFFLKKTPDWHIIEVELSSHNPYEHVVPQIGRFAKGIANLSSQDEIVNALYDEIAKNSELMSKVKSATVSGEVYKFLKDCVSSLPKITISGRKRKPSTERGCRDPCPTSIYC